MPDPTDPTPPPPDTFAAALTTARAFRDARDWRQFHTPRNLAAALAIEAGELQETLLWKGDDEVTAQLQNGESRAKIAAELADVLIYALLFADAIGVDPAEAIRRKLAINEAKYPVEKARGNAKKYDEL